MKLPRTISPSGRQLIILLCLLLITAIYLIYLFDPATGGLQDGKMRKGKWLLRGMWLAYTLWAVRMGFGPDIHEINEKSVMINGALTVVNLVGVAVGLIVFFGWWFYSFFPNWWSAAEGLVILVGILWLASLSRWRPR